MKSKDDKIKKPRPTALSRRVESLMAQREQTLEFYKGYERDGWIANNSAAIEKYKLELLAIDELLIDIDAIFAESRKTKNPRLLHIKASVAKAAAIREDAKLLMDKLIRIRNENHGQKLGLPNWADSYDAEFFKMITKVEECKNQCFQLKSNGQCQQEIKG